MPTTLTGTSEVASQLGTSSTSTTSKHGSLLLYLEHASQRIHLPSVAQKVWLEEHRSPAKIVTWQIKVQVSSENAKTNVEYMETPFKRTFQSMKKRVYTKASRN